MKANNSEYTNWQVGGFWDEKNNSQSLIQTNWSDVEFILDECNELVNFYFQVTLPYNKCPHCEGGYPPRAFELCYGHNKCYSGFKEGCYEEFVNTLSQMSNYDIKVAFGNMEGEYVTRLPVTLTDGRVVRYHKDLATWQELDIREPYTKYKPKADNIEDPMSELFPSGQDLAEQYLASEDDLSDLGGIHDYRDFRYTISKYIVENEGLDFECSICHGLGEIPNGEEAICSLSLWFIQPRRGYSHGRMVESITEADLPAVYQFLAQTRTRHQNLYAKIEQLQN